MTSPLENALQLMCCWRLFRLGFRLRYRRVCAPQTSAFGRAAPPPLPPPSAAPTSLVAGFFRHVKIYCTPAHNTKKKRACGCAPIRRCCIAVMCACEQKRCVYVCVRHDRECARQWCYEANARGTDCRGRAKSSKRNCGSSSQRSGTTK